MIIDMRLHNLLFIISRACCLNDHAVMTPIYSQSPLFFIVNRSRHSACRNRLISSSPWGEVIHIARLETNFKRTLSPQELLLSQSPSSRLRLVRVHLREDFASTGKQYPSRFLRLRFALHMAFSYYFSYISGIYFPNRATRKSLLIILTRISNLHLYKGRSPITKSYSQQLILI